ncbi:MAG: YceD family protein [Pseudomonadota bacterium]
MFDQWQQPLDIPDLIRKGVTLEGEVRVSDLRRASGRLAGVVLNDPLVRYSFRFGRNEAGHRMVEGEVATAVDLVCQRCLEPVSVDIHADVMLGVVQDEQGIAKLPESAEPLLLGDEPVCLADLIEDEILLALPVAPRHEHLCAPLHREYEDAEAVENPFAALRDWVKPSTH